MSAFCCHSTATKHGIALLAAYWRGIVRR